METVARGTRGAVVAPHHLATAAGLEVLRAGGNAVDAAIATSAVLGVVQPDASGIGGDAFWLIWDQRSRSLVALNGSGRAGRRTDPSAVPRDHLDRMPERGPQSITVPGAGRAWADVHARFATVELADLLAPAIRLAEDGFPMWTELAATIEKIHGAIGTAPWAAGFAATFRPDGIPWRSGSTFRQPALAATLRRIATVAPGDLYDGALADRQATFLGQVGATLEAADLAAHRSDWETPIRGSYRGVEIATHPPNSSGMVLLELLAILDALPAPGTDDRGWAEAIHQGIEASRIAMADRDRQLADPALGLPVAALLDHERLDGLAATIGSRASRPPAEAGVGGTDTAFLGVVDEAGNAVSLIQSLYSGFGSGVVDPETGIVYQNRGACFTLRPDHPNSLAPSKRPLHTLIPAMALRDGSPWLVIGTMGGHAQPQIVGQVLRSILDDGLDIGSAIARPRWYAPPAVDDGRGQVLVEAILPVPVRSELVRRGHVLEIRPDHDRDFGQAHAIELVNGGPANDGSIAATTDPRSEGRPAVW